MSIDVGTSQTVRLGAIAEIVMGQAPPGTDCNREARGTAFVKAGEFEQRKPAVREWTTNPLKIARIGDVLVCVVGATTGKVNESIDCAIGRSVAAVRPNSAKLSCKYLYHFLSTQVMSLRAKAQGLAQGVITREMLQQISIPLPPLHDQNRIAEVLDQADALRAKRGATLRQLDTLTRAIFLDLFGDPGTNPKSWPQEPLGSLALKFSDGPFGSNLKTEHYTNEGVRVVRLQNIGIGEFLDNNVTYISECHFAKLKKHECLPGDVLVGTLGDPNLRACVQPNFVTLALNKADCVQIRPDKERANAEFICSLLNQKSTQRMAQDLMHGQTRIRISMGRLRGLNVPVPPVSLQREFTRRIAAVEKLKATQQTSLTEMDSLFASLQHRAFNGQL